MKKDKQMKIVGSLAATVVMGVLLFHSCTDRSDEFGTITLWSMDETQKVTFELAAPTRFDGMAIDTASFIECIKKDPNALPWPNEFEIRSPFISDSLSAVIVVRSLKTGVENEVTILIYAEVEDGRLRQLYYIEGGQGVVYWKAKLDWPFCYKKVKGKTVCNALLGNVLGSPSQIIQQYTDEGVWADTTIHMRMSANWLSDPPPKGNK